MTSSSTSTPTTTRTNPENIKTTDEEIAQQHAAAIPLCKSVEAVIPPTIGEIPLSAKTASLASRMEAQDPLYPTLPCVSTRGVVDVTLLRSLVMRGHGFTDANVPPPPPGAPGLPSPADSSIWDSKFASKNNVSVTRPSHDAWGIKSCVLLFCDDFLSTVYEMPWWHDETSLASYDGSTSFKKAVEPILQALGVDGPSGNRRIVRMLLASMPPGVTIPVHHDTGAWVKKSHRVHVPIITTPEEVLFRCGGGTAESMVRVQCDQGRVFEMNNQAKHAVSNCSANYRVHLILDYVDECDVDAIVKKRVQLIPGEIVYQTRRSIDRACDFGKTPTPSYMIIGAQKAGTTSMYEYLNKHPLCISARRRETHFFDWRWQPTLKTVEEQRDFFRKFFFYDELQKYPSCLTGDSTPSYLLHSDIVIPRVKGVCPWVKLIVMLRDPVKRAHSHYTMVTSDDGNEAQKKTRGDAWRGMSFEQVVEKELAELEKVGLLKEGLTEEEENVAFKNFLKTTPMNTGSHSLLVRGMYELQLRQWMKEFDRDRFLVMKLEDMKAEGTQASVSRAFEFLGLPDFEIVDEGAKNSRSYGGMEEGVKEKLTAFYSKYDEKLFAMLGWSGWERSG